MSDNNDNIIKFNKHTQKINKDSFFENYPYIKLTRDTNGNLFNETYLREYSEKVCYIVTVMKKNQPSIALYKYKVEQRDLVDFLNELKKSDSYMIDIEKYIPENLA